MKSAGALCAGMLVSVAALRGPSSAADDLALYTDAAEGRLWSVAVVHHPTVADFPALAPSWSPDGEKIVFHVESGDTPDIYVVEVDGGDPVQLTDHPAVDKWPSWSPDGQKIAFESNRDDPANLDIYVMDADGGNVVRLTEDPAIDAQATWSPDGQRIAFMSERDGNGEVYVMDADGSNQTRLTADPAVDYFAAWSPDGQKIAFASTRAENPRDVYVMDADGGNLIRLTDHPAIDSAPAWSPDGERIALVSTRANNNPDIYIVDADGSYPVRLTDHPAVDSAPKWSPDGQQIVMQSNRDGFYQIYTIAVNAPDRVALDPSQATTVYQGSAALGIATTGEPWRVIFQREIPADGTEYEALRLAFHPGENEAVAGNWLWLILGSQEFDLLEAGIDLTRSEWQTVVLPLAELEPYEDVVSVHVVGDFAGILYLDDLRLLASPTAVTEDRMAPLPQSFGLTQNHPNPFNSSTVVSYSLPSETRLTLTVHSLAGQKVATLVEGVRAPGSYAVTWDGRDDDGQALATGVYLYRLQAGDRGLNRRLVLLR